MGYLCMKRAAMGFALPSNYTTGNTYDDYCGWEGRWELIEGIPHSMSPLPTVKHQRISLRLASQLDEMLAECEECSVSLPVDWKIGEFTVLQPDVFVACFPFKDKKFIEQPPTLVVEVLSPSTRGKDLNLKREIYLDQKVRYYLIIDPDTEEYTVLERAGEEYTEATTGHGGHFIFRFEDGCEATVDFSRIWN